MGLFKTTNETHYHVSEKAAIQQWLAARQNRKAAEAQAEAARLASSGEYALADAQIEAAKQQRKAEENVAKEHRKEYDAQLKHEKEMRLMDESPEAYKAYLAEESKKNEFNRKLIKVGIIVLIVWFILAAIF